MNTDVPALSAQTDPFTVGQNALTDALMAWAPLAACTRLGNRMTTVKRPGFVDAEQAGKIPKVKTSFPGFLVTQAGFLLTPFGTNSRTVDARQDYLIQWATDVFNVVGLNVLKWETARALYAAGDELGGATCYGRPFIRAVAVRDAQEGIGVVNEMNPNAAPIAGWVASTVVAVEMYFPKASILTDGL